MAGKKKKKKVRAEFRKKHESRQRKNDFTRVYTSGDFKQSDEAIQGERVSGKGKLTRKRTIIGDALESDADAGFNVHLDIDETECNHGRVLSVHGLSSSVQIEDGSIVRCAVRGLLKSLNTDQRHVVAAGDRVLIRQENPGEGVILRIEPRHGLLSRTSKGRQHVIVTNVDQLLIVSSAAQPVLKPNLIDRFLVTAEKTKIRPLIVINKVDLIDPATIQPLIGVYAQMGYETLLVSATEGTGIERLKQRVQNQQTVVAGQSGVGKSSILNAIEPHLHLRVAHVSLENQKGRHTTTTAQLIPLDSGGYVVDTPGIREFQLWDVIPEEVAGYYRDLRSYVSLCRFPDCTHTHEADCAIKDAVADGKLDIRRYDSYCHLREG